MAENKKSIVVYADWIDKFEELTDDEAGKLIKHFFRYVNDLNPEAPDRTTKLMFIDIKNTLKRDLDKYENTKEERSVSGKMGNLKRYYKDLYDKVKSKKITIEEAMSEVDARKRSLSDKKVAKLADSVSVSVSDNDSVINNTNTSPTAKGDINFDKLLSFINEKTGKCFRIINQTTRAKYKARLKDGYSQADIKNAIINACNDTYHKENGLKYLKPEYFSRADTLDLHAFKKTKSVVKHIENPYKDQL